MPQEMTPERAEYLNNGLVQARSLLDTPKEALTFWLGWMCEQKAEDLGIRDWLWLGIMYVKDFENPTRPMVESYLNCFDARIERNK